MLLPHLFWLGLLLPGYVVVRLVDRRDLESGLPGMIGLSFVGTLALLTPVSIACYLVGLPVWVFAAVCGALIVAGGVELTRRRWWSDVGRLAVAAIGLQSLIVLVDVVLAARTGSFTTGDATVHMARIRFLLDHGFSNLDPFCAEPFFYPIYHTNLHHALQAAASRLTGQHLLTVWMGGLVWSKLLILSGTYYLGLTVFGRSWVAWCCALCVLGMTAHVPFLLYPNQVTPRGLFPFLLAFAARACRPDADRRLVVKTVAIALIIGQFHGLYAIFAAVGVAPLLVIVGVARLARGRRDFTIPTAAAAAIAVSLVFPGVSYLGSRHETTDRPAVAATSEDVVAPSRPRTTRAGHFIRVGDGLRMRNPRRGFNARPLRPILLIACGVAAVAVLRRRDAVLPLGATVIAAAWLFVPPLCTLALDRLGEGWVLLRAQFLFHLAWAIFVPGTVAAGVAGLWTRCIRPATRSPGDPETARRTPPGMSALTAAAAVASLAAGIEYARTWSDLRGYVVGAKAPAEARHTPLDRHLDQEAAIGKIIPAGETVLCRVEASALVVALHDVHVVASRSSSLGVPDLAQRLRDQRTMMAPGTPWDERRALLRQYGIRFVIIDRTDLDGSWTGPRFVNGVMFRNHPFVVEIDTER